MNDFKYKWKNGYKPSRDEAVRHEYLLDEGQFNSPEDRHLAEEQARKHLGLPTQIPDDQRSVLPHAPTPAESENEEQNIT